MSGRINDLLGSLAALSALAGCGGLLGTAEGTGGDAGSLDDASVVGDSGVSPADATTRCVVAHRAVMADTPAGMVTDATHLYWFDDANGVAAVHVTSKCGASPTTDLATLSDSGTGIAEDAQNLYVSTYSQSPAPGAGAVYAIAKGTGAVTKVVDAGLGAWGVAVGGGWVYWIEESGTNPVARVHPDGTGIERLPLDVMKPRRVAVLADGTVCALGTTLACLLPSSATASLTIPLDAFSLTSDAAHVYVATSTNTDSLRVVRFTPVTGASMDLPFHPGDAGAPILSGIAAVTLGVYVFYGTGLLQWIPDDGSPSTEKIIASSLPPFPFYADDDGVYWDALVNGLEMGPPIAQ